MMHRMSMLLLSLLLAGLTSCGKLIKEDRDACPGILYFQLADELDGEDRIDASVFLMPDQELAGKGTATVWDVQQKEFSFSLRRADLWGGYALTGAKNCLEAGECRLVVPDGSEWDPLYIASYSVGGHQEEVTVPLYFRKEYAALTLQFVDPAQYYLEQPVFPFDVIVRGNTCGIGALTREPVKGAFHCRMREYTEGTFIGLIPRQADLDLEMEIWGREGVYYNTELQARLPIGEMMVRQGAVTWKEENLPDIFLEVQYAQNEFQVTVLDWEPELHALGQL